MAQVVLAAAGGAVATSAATSLGASLAIASAAGAVGAFVGGQVGGVIDNLIMGPQKLADVVGPRANDLAVQVSTYGTVIPKVYGVMRLAGNVIWSTPLKETEVKETSSSGGKGGAGRETTQTSVTYEYSVTLAIAICEGKIDEIISVWADSKLLDITKLDPSGDKYNIHLGGEAHLPDSIIESFEGAGNVPSYRGVAYVVIQDFPLADYGNRIPNFTFEVRREVRPSPALEDKIKSVILIPGSGEFVYSPDVVEIVPGQLAGSEWAQVGPRTKANMHNLENRANVLVALDQLQRNLPNLEWVALVVNWFATSKDPAILNIVPKVEFKTDATTEPLEWEVAGYDRDSALEILHFDDGVPTYGGTPSDKSVVDLCRELKSRGLNVMLYPMPLVDTIADGTEDNKPWRGRIVPSSSADVTRFFSGAGGYNDFIRHYTQLSVGGHALKNYIDAFVIGSEFVGLTTYDSGGGTFPAVTALKTLAGLVKTDLTGTSVLVTYAADWSEYHSIGGVYHLDPLWTDSNIDVVGIDCYVPLTPDLPQSQITEDKIKEYWEKGEGWDYFYSDAVNRTGLTSYGGDPTFSWKNIEHWWNSAHNNPGPTPTGWTAKMKPIWFTEYGFPSVDGAANQPNVFYDPSSIESFFPRASKGRVDFRAQRQALNASEDFLEARNQESGKSDLVPRRFVWTWDARPYPFWPSLSSVWADWPLWKTGHWIQGKIGVSNLGAIVAELLEAVGFTSSDYDVAALIDSVEGYVINGQIAVRSALEQLQRAYFFDMVESNGVLVFVKRGGTSAASITEDELVPLESGNQKVTLQITRVQDLDLPRFISLNYINRASAYEQGTQISQRQTVNAVDKVSTNLPIVLADQEAKTIADVTLYTSWVGRIRYSFKLPPKYARVEPTDLITVTVNGVAHLIRVTSTTITRNGMQDVQGIAEDVSSYDFYTAPGEPPPVEGGGDNYPVTQLELLDLPPLLTDTAQEGALRIAAAGLSTGWRGAFIYRSDDGGESGGNTFNLFTSVATQSIMGAVLNTLGVGPENVFDYANEIEVALLQGTLSSVTELALLNGANVCVCGDEVIQFQTATLTGAGKYTLSKLLRGRLGTEHEIANHAAGERFVLLNSAVARETMPVALFNLLRYYKPVTAGAALADTDEEAFTYTGKTLKPFSPIQITGERDLSDNLTISWVRRTRLGGEWRDGVDVPLSEESERYEVDIMDGSDVVRTIMSTSTTCSYSAAEQTTDFGSPQSSVMVRVYQMSAVVGRGTKGEATI